MAVQDSDNQPYKDEVSFGKFHYMHMKARIKINEESIDVRLSDFVLLIIVFF